MDELDLDEVVEQVRGLHEAGRKAMLAEILGELEDAVEGSESGPDTGTESEWGKNDHPGLRSFLEYLRANY